MAINVSERPAASNVREDVGSVVTHPVGSVATHPVGSVVTHPVGSVVTHPVGSVVTSRGKCSHTSRGKRSDTSRGKRSHTSQETSGSKICATKTSKPSEKCFCVVWYCTWSLMFWGNLLPTTSQYRTKATVKWTTTGKLRLSTRCL